MVESAPLDSKQPASSSLAEQQRYSGEFSRGVSPAYQRLLERTRAEGLDIDIISGPEVGTVLQLFAANAENVLEIGTFTGLGALSIAEALPEGGKIITIDRDDGPAQKLAREAWTEAGVAGKVSFVKGDAVEVISRLQDGSLDLVFLDGDNITYQACLDAVVAKLRAGGTIIVDDTLDGELSNPTSERDMRTAEFNRKLVADTRFKSVRALNVGEGITIAIKG